MLILCPILTLIVMTISLIPIVMIISLILVVQSNSPAPSPLPRGADGEAGEGMIADSEEQERICYSVESIQPSMRMELGLSELEACEQKQRCSGCSAVVVVVAVWWLCCGGSGGCSVVVGAMVVVLWWWWVQCGICGSVVVVTLCRGNEDCVQG